MPVRETKNKRPNKKVAFVIRSLAGGGAERVILTLAKEFSQNQYDVTFVIFENEIAYSVPHEINLILLKNNFHNRLARDLAWLAQLRKIFVKEKITSVISFLPKPNIYTVIASSFLKIRTIISERNDPKQNVSRVIDRIRKLVYRFADFVVFQTKEAREYFSYIPEDKCRYIPNPLNSNLPDPYNGPKKKKFVNFCRMNKQKNLKLLLEAFYDVHKKYEDYFLVIYGEGETRAELEEVISKRNMESYCELREFRRDVHNLIKDSFCFVSSSDYEGISNSMLEAMALGLPVICTDCPCGGARMFIRSYKNGILTRVGNKEELAKSMIWVIENPIKAEDMGKEAIKIRNFLNENVIYKEWKNIVL